MKKIDELMKKAVENNVFPGGILLVSQKKEIFFNEAYGVKNIHTKLPVTQDTIFDLASLTKPLSTTLAIIKLIQLNKLDIEQKIGSIIFEFRNSEKEEIKIKHLLVHNSGLPAHRNYFKRLRDIPLGKRKSMLRHYLLKEPLIDEIGKNVLYSDLGFMILSWIIEKVSGRPLDLFVGQEIYTPLGIQDLFFPGLNSKIEKNFFATTEFCNWRNELLEGVVHDDNAFVVGGVVGHAGLFGTVNGLYKLLSELLSVYYSQSEKEVIDKNILKIFFKKQGNTGRTLGFDTPSGTNSSSGNLFSENTIGHLGFSGTSFWMDIYFQIIIILLTNRVHPTRDNLKIKDFRPEIHNAVMRIVKKKDI